ncbi:hypothetical protein NAT51_03980 [Flavobacterium amniphilum]|uniref:hypothetical protein n=1 Tax=Flavobacterium amniphilum TaxID=1834035 RepID=UPI00202A3293|nr:hypothetical protein [Flavobacterium amniphilum]MCL9804666.1 hypothetical protein [Flavobacterium amniphilum]
MEEFYDLEQKIATNPRLDFGTVFNESLELFKKIWGKGALFMLFYLLGSFLLMMLLGMPLSLLGVAIDDVNATGSGFTTLAGLGAILFMLLFFVVIITFVTGLMAGFFHGCKKADEGGEFRTSDYFTFFEGRYLKRTVGVGLATFGVALLSAILCYLPLIYTSIPLSYFVVIYAFNPHLSTTEIVKLAFKLGTNKWGITFASTFVVLLLAYLGAIITCGIGFIFTFSFMLIPRYYIYKGVVGFNTADVLDEIGQDSEFDNL